MAIRNLIVNGTFDAGASGWSGNDIEANFSESAYIGTNPGNIVSEIDGNSGQTTVMQQTFSVNGPKTSTLNFDAALRTASNSNAGSEGFTVEILDSTGVAIASMSIFPTANALTGFSLPVTFPSAGNYTVRFTELGPDDSLGAIIDDIQLLVCFGGETLISAKSGPKPAKGVKVGDLIDTLRGSKPVRWVGRRRVSHDAMVRDIKLRPVRIAAGALGQGLPLRDLHVSRQHRMLVRSPICQRMFGAAEVFVAAVRLVGLPGISIDMPGTALEYVHILFDEHEVVLANGAPAESLLLTQTSLGSLSATSRAELERRYPQIGSPDHARVPAAHIPKRTRQKALVGRLKKNNRLVLATLPCPERPETAAG